MSFIDIYTDKYRLVPLDEGKKNSLKKLENKLSEVTETSQDGCDFFDAIKEYSDQIADIIARLSKHFEGWEVTWHNAFSSLQFVYNIAIEVYQIIINIRSSIIKPGMSADEEWNATVEFGSELIYFIWMTIGPLDKLLNWVPFKKTIEKKLVLWLGRMGIESAHRLFTANKETAVFSINNTVRYVKAL